MLVSPLHSGRSSARGPRPEFLPAVLHRSWLVLDAALRAYRKNPGLGWIADSRTYLRGQTRMLETAFSKRFCAKLARAVGGRKREEPRIYGIVNNATAADHLEPLTTEYLEHRYRALLRDTELSLAELWAIPPVTKLLLIERLAATAETWPPESERLKIEFEALLAQIKSLEGVGWRDLVESLSTVHQILKRDPSGVYSRMDFESRDLYRQELESIAYELNRAESQVARMAVLLAWEADQERNRPQISTRSAQLQEKRAHIGYYLLGPGLPYLRRRIARERAGIATQEPTWRSTAARLVTRMREMASRVGLPLYIGGIATVTALLAFAVYALLQPISPWWIALLAIPLSQPAVLLLNLGLSLFLLPKTTPRLDFSEGIPDEHRTFVVVPTLLLSQSNVERLLERLEIHYLANRDPNLFFALLTDFTDAPAQTTKNDSLLEICASGIRALNRRYAPTGRAPFYLFHRARQWNSGESVWMGRERKRGKLEDFNRILLGLGDDFDLKIGDTSVFPTIRYVVTLDSDTQLPRDAAWKLVGTMAHPLQRPVLDPVKNVVKNGHAILQPRVSISMESAGKSRFARIMSGQTGLDPYSMAVSDVYQDLFGRASFTGKGIYDLRAFHAVADARFPENTLLSHDLIEGEHASVGLVTDIDVIDDYPGTYEAYSKRKHRWVRGDWQIAAWLLPLVPSPTGSWVRNPLDMLARWKIFDNLRRSLFEISLTVFLVAAWVFGGRAANHLTAVAFAILALPIYADLLSSLFHLPPKRFVKSYLLERLAEFGRAHLEAAITLTYLLNQALLMGDAILRTLWRMLWSRKHLLEWQSMAATEASVNRGFDLMTISFLACPILATIFGIGLPAAIPALSFIVTALWIGCPLVARMLNGSPRLVYRERPSDADFLRGTALGTWRYFADYSRAEDHWLIPDNVEIDPEVVAHRASPTNFGLQASCELAALDFGYVTYPELAQRLGNLLHTFTSMERGRGHFYNWYNTDTLTPIAPRYISTVDSGNCAAALIVVKQGCESLKRKPLISAEMFEGIRDHVLRVRHALPPNMRSASIMKLFAGLTRQLEARPTNLFFWEGALSDAAASVRQLNTHINDASAHLDRRDPEKATELRYWQTALNQRVEAAVASLAELAPWLDTPYETELRAYAHNPGYRKLMEQLAKIPMLGELVAHYGVIESALAGLDKDGLPAKLRDLFNELSQDLSTARIRAQMLVDSFTRYSRIAGDLVREMDFSFLFDRGHHLFRIGYNVETGKLDRAHYDLLASEARTAVFLAVAKRQAPREAWFRMSRMVASFRGHRTLMSWSGTMFEYLMPALFMKTFTPTLMAESLSGVVKIQKIYGREQGVPWGISESSCSSRNQDLAYDYYAFGVPPVSLRGSAERENLVVAPYATILALMVDRPAAIANLRDMMSHGWTGRYGFYEAVDFATNDEGEREAVIVRSYMAHHQGMSLISLDNVLCNGVMQERFHAEPMVAATELLLQERIPAPFESPEPSDEPLPATPEPALRAKRTLLTLHTTR